MILVHGRMAVPARLRDDWLASAAVAGPLSRQEDGCDDFVYTADLFHPDQLHVFEAWRDREVFARHIHAPHHVARVNELKAIGLGGWSDVTYFDAVPVSRASAMGL